MSRALAAVVAAAALTVTAAPHASAATTGGVIVNRTTSAHNVGVSGNRPGYAPKAVYPGQSSKTVGVSNVQCFYVVSQAQSQYGGIYGPGWHCMSHNGISLTLYTFKGI